MKKLITNFLKALKKEEEPSASEIFENFDAENASAENKLRKMKAIELLNLSLSVTAEYLWKDILTKKSYDDVLDTICEIAISRKTYPNYGIDMSCWVDTHRKSDFETFQRAKKDKESFFLRKTVLDNFVQLERDYLIVFDNDNGVFRYIVKSKIKIPDMVYADVTTKSFFVVEFVSDLDVLEQELREKQLEQLKNAKSCSDYI